MAKKAKSDPVLTAERREAPLPVAREVLRFAQIIGQDRAIDTLSAAVSSQRLHHAWIFSGPTGVGKFTTALSFAAALLDPDSKPDTQGRLTPPADSYVQRLIASGTHPDVHIIRKELAEHSRDPATRKSKQTNIAVEVVREFFLEPATRTRQVNVSSRAHKILIIDEAHMLDQYGQNAVLKTLEEPSEGTIIILVTNNEDRLLPTVRSRSQRIVFTPLDDASMKRWLASRGIPALPEWLAHFAAGSPGTVLWAQEFGLDAFHAPVEAGIDAMASGRFKHDLGKSINALADKIAERLGEETDQASKDVAGKAGAADALKLTASILDRRLRRALAAGEDAERWIEALERIPEAERFAASNVNRAFVMDNLAAGIWRALTAARAPA